MLDSICLIEPFLVGCSQAVQAADATLVEEVQEVRRRLVVS